MTDVGRAMAVEISIVLATHNGARYLAEQLESLAKQTLPPFELIVSDDNSSDATVQIVSDFAKTAPFPVKLKVNAPALGFRANFIAGIDMAAGAWIAFCDQDAVWRPEKLERVAAFAGDPRVTMIVHQAALIDQDGATTGAFDQGISKTTQHKPLHLGVWDTYFGFSIIVRRKVLEHVDPARRFVDFIDPRHRIAHDRWAGFLAQMLGETVEIAEHLVSYRQHESNVYGADGKPPRLPRSDFYERQRPYIDATRSMLEIATSLPGDTEDRFPGFDRARANAVYASALRHQEHRGRVFSQPRLASAFTVLRGAAAGCYRAPHDGSMQWRSLAKDLKFVVGR